MQKKSVLSLCIAMALSGNSYAETAPLEKKRPTNSCPTNISVLTEAQKAKLPAGCLKQPSFLEEQWEWVAGGVAAVAAAVGIAVANDGGGDNGDSGYTPPTPPTPPDDGGDTPTPPDDDGGVPPTPPAQGPVEFANGVVWDGQDKTLTITPKDSGTTTVWTYTDNGDGTYTLTDADGKTAQMDTWNINGKDGEQTVTLTGLSEDGTIAWIYDSEGRIRIVDPANMHPGDGKTNVIPGIDVSGDGKTGQVISGDDTNNTIDGGSKASDGATGTLIDGDGSSTTISGGSSADGEGSTGTKINGNDATVDNQGGSSATNGGTGTDISGDGNTATTGGDSTISGDGSTGTKISGDDNTANNNGNSDISGGGTGTEISGDGNTANISGDTDISGGGTGTEITGDGNTANIDGDSTIDGSGSTGIDITGDNNKVINTGDTYVNGGATGFAIGGKTNDFTNIGSITVDGVGSTGVVTTGDGNIVTNDGNLTVTGGGTGAALSGHGNTVNSGGAVSVSSTDENTRSTGVTVGGDNNQINQTGALNVGDFSTGFDVTGNSNTVSLNSDAMNITGQKATGVNVSGEGNIVTLTGNMTVDKNQKAGNAAQYFYDASTGIAVGGANNTVTLDGSLTVVSDTENAGSKYAAVSGSQEIIKGLTVTGDGNTVNLKQGVNLVGETDAIADITAGNTIANARKGSSKSSVIDVSGKSAVNLSGKSTINGNFPAGIGSVFMLSDGASLTVMDGATLTMGVNSLSNYNYEMDATPLAKLQRGARATISAGATFQLQDIAGFQMSGAGTTMTNDGTLEIDRTSLFSGSGSMRGIETRNGASAVNNGQVIGKVINQNSISAGLGLSDDYAPSMTMMSVQLMAASNQGANVTNGQSGSLEVYGRGYGMSAQSFNNGTSGATADNYGGITTDALWKDSNDTTSLNSSVGNNVYDYSAGMIAGSGAYSKTGSNAVATNHQGGTITVYNAGAGMVAQGNNTVINQGTINLEQNGNYNPATPTPLVGMAVYKGGTAVNDTTGVININADNGKAFYNDGRGLIVNKGSINLNGSPMSPSDSHMGSAPTNKTYLDSVYGSASITTLDDPDGFIMPGVETNYGSLTLSGGYLPVNGSLYNRAGATLNADVNVGANSTFFNDGNFTGKATMGSYSAVVVNTGTMTAKNDGDAVIKGDFQYFNQAGGVITNGNARAVAGGTNYLINNTRTADSAGNGVNSGKIVATNGYGAISLSDTKTTSNNKVYQNTAGGEISGSGVEDKALIQLGKGYNFVNAGTITLEGITNAVAIQTSNTGYEQTVINAGTINLGSASDTSSGLIAMKGSSTANTTFNNTAAGVINIYADDSYAFGGSYTKVINHGQVNLACGNSTCGIFAPGASNTSENKDTADLTIPAAATAPAQGSVPADPDATVQTVSGYQVGTNADGTAGMLKASRMMLQDVSVDTGFTAGTAATTETFNDVFVGKDIQGVENIKSASVVWTATGEKDSNGNVDVTMTKNAYADVTGDAGVNSVANALDAAYTNNELYNSLNLKTSAELDSALKQISGSKATGVSRDARILSNRFDMLADAAPVMNNGLAFNVVAKGDQRAELSNDTTYDMLALRQSLAFGGNQTLSMEYGIARLDGNGNAMSAGDNGVTGGYSQFFGLKHSLPLSEDGLSWDNALRYDVHNFDSNRAVRYGDVNKTANADTRQQYMEFRTEGSKAFKVQEGLTVTPFAGLKMRHTMEDGYSEKGAGDFNLNMSSSSETAVDAVVGLKLSYAGEDGWAATASLEGGPNLSYAKSNRTASLAGAKGQTFSVQDDQQGGGVNGQAMVGVKYSAGDAHFTADAYHWQEDGVKDKGFMVNYKYTF